MKNKPNKKKELLFSVSIKDCEVQTFRSGGPGGQHQNKTDSGARVIHHASGARGEARDSKSQLLNKKSAFKRMLDTDTFKMWLKIKSAELMGKPSIEEIVEEQMNPKNIKTEVRDVKGKWVNKESQ